MSNALFSMEKLPKNNSLDARGALRVLTLQAQSSSKKTQQGEGYHDKINEIKTHPRVSPITPAQWVCGTFMIIATVAAAYYYPEIFLSHEKPL